MGATTPGQGVLDLSPEPANVPAAGVQGNVLAGLGGLLGSFGVLPTSERDSVEVALGAELAARGLSARVSRVRFGVAHVDADAQTAALLRFASDDVLAAVARVQPGTVERLRVRVCA